MALTCLLTGLLAAGRTQDAAAQAVFPGDLSGALADGGLVAGPVDPAPPTPPPALPEDPGDPLDTPVGAQGDPAPFDPIDSPLRPFSVEPVANVLPGCGCMCSTCSDMPDDDGIREISDFMDGGTEKSLRLTNYIWSWGQFLDHDMIASFTDPDRGQFSIDLPRGPTPVSRVKSDCKHGCPAPRSVQTPVLDAGPIYSANETARDTILREPGSCRMRTSNGRLPPVTAEPVEVQGEVEAGDGAPEEDPSIGGAALEADDSAPPPGGANFKHIFLAGDGRVNEHAVLTNMHTVWLREHNRLCDIVEKRKPGLTGDEAFKLVREIIIGKFHEITLHEWLPALGIRPKEVFKHKPIGKLANTAALSTEFFITYRWGHDGVPDFIGGEEVAKIFDGEKFMDIQGPDGSATPKETNARLEKLIKATAGEAQGDLDGKMSDALRNMLFGEFDLASFNIFRGRDMFLPGYRELAHCYGVPADPTLPTDDPFVATLLDARNAAPGQAFGPLLRAIMIDQFHRLFFGPEGNWWEWEGFGAGFEDLIVGTTLASIINGNTENANVQKNVFIVP